MNLLCQTVNAETRKIPASSHLEWCIMGFPVKFTAQLSKIQYLL